MAQTPPGKFSYTVLVDGWVQNRYRTKGDTLTLNETEAQYDVLGGKVERTKPARKPAPEKTD